MSSGEVVLRQFTIYNDGPEGQPFVVRGWSIVRSEREPLPDAHAYGYPSLEAARTSLPVGLHRLDRHPDDNPTIVEVWT